jgi:hypothetical protein
MAGLSRVSLYRVCRLSVWQSSVWLLCVCLLCIRLACIRWSGIWFSAVSIRYGRPSFLEETIRMALLLEFRALDRSGLSVVGGVQSKEWGMLAGGARGLGVRVGAVSQGDDIALAQTRRQGAAGNPGRARGLLVEISSTSRAKRC